MVTTVGRSTDLSKLIENFILLERDAIAAYDETIDRLERPEFSEQIRAFREDHHRHLRELQELAGRHQANVPAEGDVKQVLTTGKVQLADMMGGDGALLKAMSSNENDTISAYENACGNAVVPAEAKPIFERGLSDERRHKQWMDDTAQAL